MPKLSGDLGPLERVLMELLWDREEATVREVLDAVPERRLAYTTVMTVLDRLWRKGFLARRRVGRAYVYRPKRTREDHARALVEELIAASPDRHGLLLGFVRGVGAEDLGELRRLIRSELDRRKIERSK
ncbi:MAG: BlaI/MecI/CopY family transcriptional regulator [Actinomycetota bacterium]